MEASIQQESHVLLRLRLCLTQDQSWGATLRIFTIRRCPQILLSHLLSRYGMCIVERNDASIRPEHRMLAQLIRPGRIFRVRLRHEGHIVRFSMRPAFLKSAMPEREVPQSEDLPHPVLLDVLVLVYTALPPLDQAARVCILDALVRTGGHHASEAAFRAGAVCGDVHDALDLGVIE